MSDKPVKKPATPKISPRAATSVSVTPGGRAKVEVAEAPVVAPKPVPVVAPEPVKPPPVHPSQAVVNDDGKKDYREQIKDGERNAASGELIAKKPEPVEQLDPEEMILGIARETITDNFARLWGHLPHDNPPELFPFITIEDTVLHRNMLTGGYTVIGPKNGRVDFLEGEEFDMLECFRTNAQMSSHNAEMKKRQAGQARRLIP